MGFMPGMDPAKAEAVTKNFQDTLVLQEGNQVIRVVYGVEKIREHWIPTTVNDRETGSPKTINKSIRCTETPDCPLCQAARAENQTIKDEKGSRLAAKSNWLLLAIDREQQEAEKKTTVRLLKVPWTVWKALKDFQDNPKYGDMTQWDVEITRQNNPKTGFKEYVVQPARQNTPFNQEELEAFEKCDLDLPTIAAPISVDEVYNQLRNYPINLSDMEKIKSPEAIVAFFKGVNHVESVSLLGRQGSDAQPNPDQKRIEGAQFGTREEGSGGTSRPQFGGREEPRQDPPPAAKQPERESAREPERTRGREGHGKKDDKKKGKKRPF